MDGEAGPPGGLIPAGRVGRPHGLDGSFYVTRAQGALLQIGLEVRLGGAARVIERRAGTDEHPIVRLDAVRTREAALALRGEELQMARTDAPALGDGEFYAQDLEGCLVVDGEREIGRVREMRGLPSCEILDVERAGGGELLVPLVRDAVRSIDLQARRIDVRLAFLGEADGEG